MTHYPWDSRSEAQTGTPIVEVWIRNMNAQPIGDEVVELRLSDHPRHGAPIEALEDHGIGREVVLCMNGHEYQYRCDVGEGSDLYLAPMDDFEDKIIHPDRFLKRAFNLRMRW